MPIEEIIDAFSLEAISRSGGAFDAEKLLWMNGVYLRKLPARDLAARAMPFLVDAGLVDAGAGEAELTYAADAVALEQEKIQRLDEAPRLVDFFFKEPLFEEKSVARWLRKDGIDDYLARLGGALEGISEWSTEAIETAVRTVAATFGREKGEATHPVRVALTGRETGPSLFDLMRVLGRDTVVARLDAARGKLGA